MIEIRGDKKVLITPVSKEDLKDIKIISKEFNNDITYVIDIDKNNKQLINSLNKISQLKILKEILIKKEKNSFL